MSDDRFNLRKFNVLQLQLNSIRGKVTFVEGERIKVEFNNLLVVFFKGFLLFFLVGC